MKKRLSLRILVSPFILCIFLITYSIACITHFVGYLKHGGEWITYKKDDPGTIGDIYDELLKQRK